MPEAWIGVVGAAVGAFAGIAGGWLTHTLTSRHARRGEIREAAADLISKASLPTVIGSTLGADMLRGERPAEIVLPWSEATMRARARLAALAPESFSLCDFLWQRASDQMNALVAGDTEAAAALGIEVSRITIELEQALAHETSRQHIQRALD